MPAPSPPPDPAPAGDPTGSLTPEPDFSRAMFVGSAEHAAMPIRIGRYRILRVLGSGGMGTVYGALQDSPRREVALKVLNGTIPTAETVRRFEREARILGSLRHPGIAQVYDAGIAEVEGGAPPVPPSAAYFAMELLPGAVTLIEHARHRGFDAPAILRLVAEVCDAVAHAHERGVIHRDLKPSNLLVDAEGRPKVIDFGVARLIGVGAETATLRTQPGMIVGTLRYMSPEQLGVGADPHTVDARSDVYALGAVLYELLCGRPPFEIAGMSIPAVIELVRTREPESPQTVNPALSQDAAAVVMKALSKERHDRYASAALLREDLLRAADGRAVTARPLNAPRRAVRAARRWAARSPGLASAASVALTALACHLIVVPVVRPTAERVQKAFATLAPATLASGNLDAVRIIALDDASAPDALEAAAGVPAGTMAQPFGKRPILAALIRRLAAAGAGAIGVDFILEDETPFDQQVTDAVTDARDRGTDVVFATASWAGIHGGAPLAPALRSAARWGAGNARAGGGALTQMQMSVENPGAEGVPCFALACLVAHDSPGAIATTRSEPDGTFLEVRRWRKSAQAALPVSAGPATRFRVTETVRSDAYREFGIDDGALVSLLHISFPPQTSFAAASLPAIDALTLPEPDLRRKLGGRTALIGAAVDRGRPGSDSIQVEDGRWIFGIEAHAATIQALRDGTAIRVSTPSEEHVWAGLAAALGIVSIRSARTTRARLSFTAAAAAAVAIASAAGIALFSYLSDPVVPAVGTAIAAALWAWLSPARTAHS